MSSLPFSADIAQIIVKDVQPDDRDDLWRWRNDPSTRAHSLNTESVPYEQHCKWFESAFNSTNQFLMLGSMRNKMVTGTIDKVGVVRFDIASIDDLITNPQTAVTAKKAIVSINLNPDFRGIGISAPLLIEAINSFKNRIASLPSQLSEIIYIEATIKEDNKASIKCFKRAGFAAINNKHSQSSLSDISGQKQFRLLLD